MKLVVLALALCLAGAVSACAKKPLVAPSAPRFEAAAVSAVQPVNPGGIEFSPSPDDGLIANGGPMVTKYSMDVANYATDAAGLVTPTTVVKAGVDLGRPVIGAVTPGKATVMWPETLFLTSVPTGSYVAVVKAEGPGGVSGGATSDPFTVKPKAPGAPGKPVWK